MTAAKVTVLAFPDGSSVWLKDASRDDLELASRAWRESLTSEERQRHEADKSCGGAVVIYMPEEDYQRIPATNHPSILALLQEDSGNE